MFKILMDLMIGHWSTVDNLLTHFTLFHSLRRQEKVQTQSRPHPYGPYVQRAKPGQAAVQPRLGGDLDAEGEADQLESDDDRMNVERADLESEESINGGSRRASVAARHPRQSLPNGNRKGPNVPHGYPAYHAHASGAPVDDDPDADAEGDLDLDADGDLEMGVEGPASTPRNTNVYPNGHSSRRGSGVPASLADLDSPTGRYVIFVTPFR